MHRTIRNMLWSIAALMCGLMLYILLRPDSYLGKLFSAVNQISALQNAAKIFEVNVLRYYLPDMLWALALGCSLQAVIAPKGTAVLICGGTSLLWGAIWELLQWSGLVGGTGDWVDVLMYFSGALASVIINMKEIKK